VSLPTVPDAITIRYNYRCDINDNNLSRKVFIFPYKISRESLSKPFSWLYFAMIAFESFTCRLLIYIAYSR